MTQRLTPLDTAFLRAEDADQHTRLGIGGLAILDGPPPDHQLLLSTLGERISICPRFAQRLRRQVLDLSAPEWVDDDKFDLANHVCRVAVPAPGTDEELFRVVADVMSWRLDRNRPLWEIWIIDGLADNRWAMLMKVHPCLADAVATVHILTGLSDDAASAMSEAAAVDRCVSHHPAGRALTRPDAVPAVSAAPQIAGWAEVLRDSVRFATDAVDAARQALRGSRELAAGLLRPVSALNGPVTSRRRYSAARVALADVRKICRTFDVTVDDVALAALAESYRNMLLRRGEQPHADSLRALVPVAMRGRGAGQPSETRQAALLPRLPVHEDNPVLRLRMVHARMAGMKAAACEQPGNTVASAANRLPFPLAAVAMDLLSRLPQRNVATLAVNVPGPRQPLRILGCDVVQVLPIPPIGMQLRTAAAVMSYADELFFGIVADFSAVPDADELARGVETAVARLLVRARRRRVGRDRHGLRLVVNT